MQASETLAPPPPRPPNYYDNKINSITNNLYRQQDVLLVVHEIKCTDQQHPLQVFFPIQHIFQQKVLLSHLSSSFPFLEKKKIKHFFRINILTLS